MCISQGLDCTSRERASVSTKLKELVEDAKYYTTSTLEEYAFGQDLEFHSVSTASIGTVCINMVVWRRLIALKILIQDQPPTKDDASWQRRRVPHSPPYSQCIHTHWRHAPWKDFHRTIHGWYFPHLRSVLGIKHSYCSRMSNAKVWKQAAISDVNQINDYATIANAPCGFSPGFTDRIKFTKSKSRGCLGGYWYELVSKEAVRYYQHRLDYHAMPERRRNVLGLKQFLSFDRTFGNTLTTAPTRTPELFPCSVLQLEARGKPKKTNPKP